MKELFELAVSPVNLPLSILFGLVILYWVLTLIVGLDIDLFDIDVDVDLDVDADAGIDARGNLDIDLSDTSNTELKKEQVVPNRGKKLNAFQIILVYFNFVGLPFMFTFSFFVLFWWAFTMSGTTLTGSENSDFGFLFFFIGIIPALIVTKICTNPFKSFFKNFNSKGEKALDFFGRQGILKSNISGDRLASLEIIIESSPIKVMVKSQKGEPISANTKVMIIDETPDKKIFLVVPI